MIYVSFLFIANIETFLLGYVSAIGWPVIHTEVYETIDMRCK